MPPSSKPDADALRLWLSVTASAYADQGIGLPLPRRPLGLMILVHLWLEAERPVSYLNLRAVLRLEREDRLGEAIDLLEQKGLVVRAKGDIDAREREVRLTSKGRDVIGRLLQARHPKPK